MKKLILFLIITILINNGYAQIEIYKTVNDFKNNTPIKYSNSAKVGMHKRLNKQKSYLVSFKIEVEGKEDTIIKLSDIWGYKYKNILFRTFNFQKGEYNIAHAALISSGKYCYWEAGEAVMEVLDNPKGKAFVYFDPFYFSTDTLSEIIIQKNYRQFFNKDFQLYKPLCDESYKIGQTSGAKYKNIKMGNKIYKLGGEDGIAYVNMYSIAKEMEYIRKAIESTNGKLNPAIIGSIYLSYNY